MTDHSEFTPEEIAAVREVMHRAWFRLQEEHEKISGDCIHMPIGDVLILQLVADNPEIILRNVREALGMPHSTLTSAIDRLEARSLLRRTITDKDRRSYGLELTRDGRAFQERHDRADNDLAIRVLRILGSDRDRLRFIEVLQHVVDRLG